MIQRNQIFQTYKRYKSSTSLCDQFIVGFENIKRKLFYSLLSVHQEEILKEKARPQQQPILLK